MSPKALWSCWYARNLILYDIYPDNIYLHIYLIRDVIWEEQGDPLFFKIYLKFPQASTTTKITINVNYLWNLILPSQVKPLCIYEYLFPLFFFLNAFYKMHFINSKYANSKKTNMENKIKFLLFSLSMYCSIPTI